MAAYPMAAWSISAMPSPTTALHDLDYLRQRPNFSTVVPLPAAAWAGLALLAGLGISRIARRAREA